MKTLLCVCVFAAVLAVGCRAQHQPNPAFVGYTDGGTFLLKGGDATADRDGQDVWLGVAADRGEMAAQLIPAVLADEVTSVLRDCRAVVADLSTALAAARGCDRSRLWLFNGGPRPAMCVPRTGATVAYTFAPGTPVAVPALDYECRGIGGETRLSVVSCPPEGSAEAVVRGAMVAAMPAQGAEAGR